MYITYVKLKVLTWNKERIHGWKIIVLFNSNDWINGLLYIAKRVKIAVKRKFIRKSCSGKFSSFENNASRNGPKNKNIQ